MVTVWAQIRRIKFSYCGLGNAIALLKDQYVKDQYVIGTVETKIVRSESKTMRTNKFDRGDIVCTNINEQHRTYTVVSYFYLKDEVTCTDWLNREGTKYLGFEPGWNYMLVECKDITQNHVFVHEDRLKVDIGNPPRALINVCFERKSKSYYRSLAITKLAMRLMIESGEIDRSQYLTPDDIIWLKEWLSKAKNSEIEYKIYVFSHEERPLIN